MIQEDRDEKKKTTTAKEKIKKLLMRKRKYEGKKGINLFVIYLDLIQIFFVEILNFF